MAVGLQKTWNLLARTRNAAAIEILRAALGGTRTEVRGGALRTLVRRPDATSHNTIIRQYADCAEAEQLALQAALREAPERLTAALGEAVIQGDREACVNACNIILLGQVYDLFPMLTKTAENRDHHHAPQLGATLLRLATLLHQEMAAPTGGTRRGRRDPFFVRRQSLAVLSESIARYEEHRRLEILEAFLLLAPADHKLLLAILRDPLHAAHHQLVASLADSKSPGVMQCAIALLFEADTPAAALRIVARRSDRSFLEQLFQSWRRPVSLRVRQNLGRMTHVAWLEADREVLLQLDEQAQVAAVELVRHIGIGRDARLQCLALLLRRAAPQGRQAACEALADFQGRSITELIMFAARDGDPGVRAAAAAQLRHRSLPAETVPWPPVLTGSPEPTAGKPVAEDPRGAGGQGRG